MKVYKGREADCLKPSRTSTHPSLLDPIWNITGRYRLTYFAVLKSSNTGIGTVMRPSSPTPLVDLQEPPRSKSIRLSLDAFFVSTLDHSSVSISQIPELRLSWRLPARWTLSLRDGMRHLSTEIV